MNKKILIVEDEPSILRALQFQLERIGKMDVIFARDGEEAVKMIEAERPRLIFLDLMLPKKNGYEICQWIKETPYLSDIHVIILSAKGQEYEISQGMNVGADEYMTKPFDPQQVLRRAQEILGKEPISVD
jgi:two-component system alkaline phosphatase synthesis response regulator PhoP